MDEKGTIEIRVSGTKGNFQLTPDNYDIREIAAMFEVLENLVFPNAKKSRPEITYTIAEGSVRHIFKTSFQTVITFTAILASLSDPRTIDKLDIFMLRRNGFSVPGAMPSLPAAWIIIPSGNTVSGTGCGSSPKSKSGMITANHCPVNRCKTLAKRCIWHQSIISNHGARLSEGPDWIMTAYAYAGA